MKLSSSRLTLWLTLALALLAALGFTARAAAQSSPMPLYFFWSTTCPHCAEAKPFLAELAERTPGLVIRDYEVHEAESQRVFVAIAAQNGFEAQYVPTILVGDQHWVGFDDAIAGEIETAVAACARGEPACTDPGRGVVDPLPGWVDPAEGGAPQPGQPEEPHSISVPLLGTIDLDRQSLFLSTALIAFVDGFNPCSLWVLSMLLALVLHTGSRKKIALIGIIFLTITAGIYALFIAGLFSVLRVMSFVGWIQVLVALVALVFALVNIKDYFWYKEGLSFTISDKHKPGIAARIRRVMDASGSLWGLASATVVLAAGVSLVEFSCTAGFPVLWSNLMNAQGVSGGTFALHLLLYMLVYQLDELAIFAVAVLTLKASRLEEKQGRVLKLVGGMLMLTLAVVMLVNPGLMNELSSSLVIFGVAFGAALVVLLLHRVVLPRLGIRIGNEVQRRRGAGKSAKARAE